MTMKKQDKISNETMKLSDKINNNIFLSQKADEYRREWLLIPNSNATLTGISFENFLVRKIQEAENNTSYMDTLFSWIKSDSVLKAFHYMDKNPSAFDLTDDHYMDLYLLCLELRKKDKEHNESMKDK